MSAVIAVAPLLFALGVVGILWVLHRSVTDIAERLHVLELESLGKRVQRKRSERAGGYAPQNDGSCVPPQGPSPIPPKLDDPHAVPPAPTRRRP